ncbi:hypothetical protein [Propionivibrio sp.]|uniref:hypothetical protein n=1 Tax=Propionivibrio sp. TaxID=2212460 RepID=UPI003BEF9C39
MTLNAMPKFIPLTGVYELSAIIDGRQRIIIVSDDGNNKRTASPARRVKKTGRSGRPVLMPRRSVETELRYSPAPS